MKKIITFLVLAFLLSGCNTNDVKINSVEGFSHDTAKEIPIDFTIQRTVLSKGYHTLTPYVEVPDKTNPNTLLVNLGLIQCSGVTIDKVTQFNNEINIYISKVLGEESDIVVPQITISLDNINGKSLQNLRYNIVANNYKPIELAYNRNETLNNIYSQLRVSSNNQPLINIIKDNDKYLWEISMTNAFARDILNTPLVNTRALVNSSNGKIINSVRKVISQYIDDGILLDYCENGYLMYKKVDTSKDTPRDALWIYNVETGTKFRLYTTHNKIFNAGFSPDGRNVALIEHNSENTHIYIINLDGKKTYKISPLDYDHTWNMKWVDKKLFFVNNDSSNGSSFFEYDTESSKENLLFKVNKVVSEFDVLGDSFVFTEPVKDGSNSNIYLTHDGGSLKKIGTGFNSNFLSKNKVIYFKSIQNENKNSLWIYDIDKDSKLCISTLDVKNYYIIDNQTLMILGRSNYINQYSLLKYNLTDGSYEKLGEFITDDLLYNIRDNTAYINTIPSIDNPKGLSKIYSIYLDKFYIDLDSKD